MNLADKYRPKQLDKVVGHNQIVEKIKEWGRNPENAPQTFLFSGPTGVGKTTLARLLAVELGVLPDNIQEQDPVSHSSVDNIRYLVDNNQYPSLLGNGMRAIIFDECHTLSPSSWQTILKSLEEPPRHLLWILCSTDPHKIPSNVMGRVHHFKLLPLKIPKIMQRLEQISYEESISVSLSKIEAIAKEAHGNLRWAISHLDSEIPPDHSPNDSTAPILSLCKEIVENNSYFPTMELFKENPSDVREGIFLYITSSWLMKNKDAERWGRWIRVLSEPHNMDMRLLYAKIVILKSLDELGEEETPL